MADVITMVGTGAPWDMFFLWLTSKTVSEPYYCAEYKTDKNTFSKGEFCMMYSSISYKLLCCFFISGLNY